MKLNIDGKEYEESSLTYSIRTGMENIKILDGFAIVEELVEFLLLLNKDESISSVILPNMNFLNYMLVNLEKRYKNLYVKNPLQNIDQDIIEKVSTEIPNIVEEFHVILSYEMQEMKQNCILISPFFCDQELFVNYFWSSQNLYITVPKNVNLKEVFPYSCKPNFEFEFRNLIELCMIVKNGGGLFQEMLENNFDQFDYWTIVDTGSTDNTISIIENVLIGKKPGQLHFCDFEDFSQARNYSLECCNRTCKYIVILDDTYFLQGDFRNTLNILRGHLTSDAYSLMIYGDDCLYSSTRIIKSNRQLYYQGKVHETIQVVAEKQFSISPQHCHIVDKTNEEMVHRSQSRKPYIDVPLLLEEIETNPYNPRNYYYLGNTFRMLREYEKAILYYEKRLSFTYTGQVEEKWNTAFELGRMIYLSGVGDPNAVVTYLKLAQDIDPSRPESDFVLAMIALNNQDKSLAYYHFKKAFDLGTPISQYSTIPIMYEILIPDNLLLLAMDNKDLNYAQQALKRLQESKLYYQNRTFLPQTYLRLERHLELMESVKTYKVNSNVCFLVPYGWSKWDGNDIGKKGIGGSETFIVQLLDALQFSDQYKFHVFCRCDTAVKVGKINYYPIETFLSFLKQKSVQHLFVNRDMFETSLACRVSTVENVYIFLHDYFPESNILDHPKLKHLIYISKYQKEQMEKILIPSLQEKGKVFYYGIEPKLFQPKKSAKGFRFMYSSLLNRGLVPLLRMWPKIYHLNNNVSLHVFCDLENQFVKRVSPEQYDYVHNVKNTMEMYNVVFHGFVGKEQLYESWSESDFWLYPCIFEETFCLTALEAAITKTLIISTPLAALTETINDRGFMIEGNPLSNEWQEKVVNLFSEIFQGKIDYEEMIESSYRWASSLKWENRATDFLQLLEQNSVVHRDSISFVNKINLDVESFLRSSNYKKILVVGDNYGVATEYFLRFYPECHVTLLVVEDMSLILKENLRRHSQNRYEIINTLPMRYIVSLLHSHCKFDFIFLNALSIKLIELCSFILTIGGRVMIEPNVESISCENLFKLFENENICILEKNYQITKNDPWTIEIPFYFPREHFLESLVSNNIDRSDKNIIEFGLGNTTSFFSKMSVNCLSFYNESSVSEEFQSYVNHNSLQVDIQKFQMEKIVEAFTKECVLIVNDSNMLFDFFQNKVNRLNKVFKIFLVANVKSKNEIDFIQKKLSKDFQFSTAGMKEHSICRFDYYQFWKLI